MVQWARVCPLPRRKNDYYSFSRISLDVKLHVAPLAAAMSPHLISPTHPTHTSMLKEDTHNTSGIPTALCKECVCSSTSHSVRLINRKGCETEPMVYSSYPRSTEADKGKSQNICQIQKKWKSQFFWQISVEEYFKSEILLQIL